MCLWNNYYCRSVLSYKKVTSCLYLLALVLQRLLWAFCTLYHTVQLVDSCFKAVYIHLCHPHNGGTCQKWCHKSWCEPHFGVVLTCSSLPDFFVTCSSRTEHMRVRSCQLLLSFPLFGCRSSEIAGMQKLWVLEKHNFKKKKEGKKRIETQSVLLPVLTSFTPTHPEFLFFLSGDT